jgi:hypothetical protein
MQSIDMTVGRRYKIFHMSETQRLLRYSVMDYLGREATESYSGEGPNYSFSARPEAGTQSVRPRDIVSVIMVSKSSPIELNKIAK